MLGIRWFKMFPPGRGEILSRSRILAGVLLIGCCFAQENAKAVDQQPSE